MIQTTQTSIHPIEVILISFFIQLVLLTASIMDEEAAIKALAMPDRSISFVPTKAGEIIRIGPVICRIMEDGSNTSIIIPSAVS